jgi:hypothetical protein
MPFTDPVSSISGRNSRASNVSAATGASRSLRSPPPAGVGVDMMANAGVLSMLKTTTDTGDIGALSFNSSRLPSMPYRSGQRRQQPSKTSGSSHPYHGGSNSHNYAASVASRVSSATRDWETGSNGRRGSMTSMQTMPTFVSDTQASAMSHPGRPMGLGPIPSSDNRRDSRSYSLTNAIASGQLPRHKSASSLKSQGHEPRRYNGPPPPMPEIRPPYVYPTRLKRPGYRSPSPALSDTYAQAPLPPMPQQHMHRRQQAHPAANMPQPPMSTYHSDYGQGYPVDPAHLNVPPLSRAMSVSPITDYEQMSLQQPQYNYRPGPSKQPPPSSMQYPGQRPPVPPVPQQHQQHHQNQYQQQQMYGPQRPVYPPNSYPMQPQHRRGPPPNQNMGPAAHHIFHNAARLARQLPQRTDTPMTDLGVPSSDPPSSGTAPSTSSPPTPKDQSTIHVAVDPAFIDPTLTDLPESISDPVIPAKYFDYIDGLEKAAEDSEIEVHHPSVPPSGFVQRVKAMLESRAAVDAAAKREAEREDEHGQLERHVDIYELSAVESPRVTIIEEFKAPVKLPASPVLIAEMPASPVKSMRRLTRDLVKAELAPSTTEIEPSSKVVIVDTPSPLKPSEVVPHEEHEIFEPSDLNEEPVDDDTPLPSSPPEIQHKGSVTESIASTGGHSKVSGIDFALHFSPPSETEATATDLGETETESRDPFILDADTITTQHKESKEHQSHDGSDDLPPQPVSPLLPGETVDRFSAVSPVQEETARIDETIMGLNNGSSPSDSKSKRAYGNTLGDELQLPPTPRTPRTYSKSVHLPQPTGTPTESNASNRLSLPADLSQIGDTTVNSTMDAMTDVAVRFSLPQSTVTMGKPQIVQIASSTPPKDDHAPLRSAIQAPERQRRHGSVTFEDEVAPLKVDKKTGQHRQSLSLGAIAVRNRSQPTRGPSPFEEQSDSDHGSRDSTADLRFSGINFIRNKYPSTHLPGLKEESSEDMSINTHRQSSDIANGLQFQLPARIAAVKAMQERRQQEIQDKAKSRDSRQRHHPDAGRPLAETRDLPSLNFSRMDLIDKLNDALQIRSTKSMEVVGRNNIPTIYHPSPQRPQSTDPALWDRYTSFFNKPEDFPAEVEEVDDSEDEDEDVAEDDGTESNRHSKAISESESGKRPLSPEERMLNVATQVNRLSIPSVNGLSERLSELLPCLRDLNLDSVLANDRIAHTFDDIHQLGQVHSARPGTVMSTRTSAGFRTLAERAEEFVNNGTHDSVIPRRALGLNKDLPPLPGSHSLGKVSELPSADGKTSSYLSGSISAPSDITNLLERPASALVRGKSPLTEDEVRDLLPPEMNPIARGSKRSLIVSSLSSRPWNLDENYPWARSNLHIDLTAPDQVHHRDGLAAEVARHRGTKSFDCTLTGDLLGNTTSGIDIGSITTDLDPSASLTTLQLTGISTQHGRKHSKRSILGSLKLKMGLGHSHHEDTTRSLPTSPGLHSIEEPTHNLNPGDRYPTTALTPPVGFNLDEVRSYFSDDSAESNKERKTSKGRRWTGLKSKNKSSQPDPARGQSLDGGLGDFHSYDAGSLTDRVGLDSSAAYTLDGIGMGKAEFRIKRFGEKLLSFFAKGGELIRSLSTRSRSKKSARERDEWLSDSLYSGV